MLNYLLISENYIAQLSQQILNSHLSKGTMIPVYMLIMKRRRWMVFTTDNLPFFVSQLLFFYSGFAFCFWGSECCFS